MNSTIFGWLIKAVLDAIWCQKGDWRRRPNDFRFPIYAWYYSTEVFLALTTSSSSSGRPRTVHWSVSFTTDYDVYNMITRVGNFHTAEYRESKVKIRPVWQLLQPFGKHQRQQHTVRNLHYLSKNSTLIFRENCQFFGGEKLVKMLWFWTP